MNGKYAVMFDLDGTLLNTLDDLVNAVNYILEKHGFPKREVFEIRRFLGNGARDLMERSLPKGIGEARFEAILEEYKKYYNEHSKIFTKPYEGVTEALKELKDREIRTAIVSNKPDDAVATLAKEYFGELVDFSVGDRPDICKKPSPDPLFFAAKALECERFVFVGDSETDISAAKNAGVPCISVTWGFRDRDVLEEAGAEITADTSSEMLDKIYSIFAMNGDN